MPLGLELGGDGAGPAFGSIFGSARNALYPTYSYQPQPLFEPNEPGLADLGLGVLEGVLAGEGSSSKSAGTCFPSSSTAAAPAVPQLGGNGNLTSNMNTHNNIITSDPAASPNHSARSFDAPLEFGPGAYERGNAIEDVLSWSDVCYFVSLFLKDQHCLVPLVHKPTFSQDVVNRRDKRDEAFRGLLCSMVAYTICQCPISTMTGAYERARLVTILHRCTKAADAIRHRQRMSPSLILLASTVLDWITAQAVGNPQVCDLLIAETTRLAHALSLSDGTPRAGANAVELQICRRLYWIIYSKDKTDALSGRPIILHDFEGLAPYPLEIDDDYITPEGHLPQPARRTSYMAGFVVIMRIFQIISQCVSRHRAFANRSADDMEFDDDGEHAHAIRWIEATQDRVRHMLRALPPNLCMDLSVSARAELDEPAGDFSLFRIQQANISITALCAEFALLDFRASLRPDEDTRAEREEMARKAYETLSSIPLEYLASNGESMVSLAGYEVGRGSRSQWQDTR